MRDSEQQGRYPSASEVADLHRPPSEMDAVLPNGSWLYRIPIYQKCQSLYRL